MSPLQPPLPLLLLLLPQEPQHQLHLRRLLRCLLLPPIAVAPGCRHPGWPWLPPQLVSVHTCYTGEIRVRACVIILWTENKSQSQSQNRDASLLSLLTLLLVPRTHLEVRGAAAPWRSPALEAGITHLRGPRLPPQCLQHCWLSPLLVWLCSAAHCRVSAPSHLTSRGRCWQQQPPQLLLLLPPAWLPMPLHSHLRRCLLVLLPV